MGKTSLRTFHPKISRTFIAKLAGKDIGFIRILNTSDWYEEYSGESWGVGEVYVKLHIGAEGFVLP